MTTLDDVLAAILRVEAKLDELREKQAAPTLRGVVRLARHLGAVEQPSTSSRATAAPRIASDAEIDDPERGDKEVRKDPSSKGPRGWKGDSYKGRRWSECPPDYLDALAGFHDWCASKKREEAAGADGDEKTKLLKYAVYDEADAAKCRAWAARKRKYAAANEQGPPNEQPPREEEDDFR